MELEQSWDKSQFHPNPVPSRIDRINLSHRTAWDMARTDWFTLGTVWDTLRTKDSLLMKSSRLTPYQTLIGSLRKEGKSYRKIVEILRERHGLRVGRNTVHSFVKVRSKRPRKVYTMLENQLSSPGFSSKNESNQTLTRVQPAKRVPGGNGSGTPPPKRFNYTYSDTYNLTRLTPEEAAALEKKLDDEQTGQA